MSVRNVERLLFEAHYLCNIKEFILARSPISVMSVERLLSVVPNSLSIRGFILTKSRMNVKNVERPSVMAHN